MIVRFGSFISICTCLSSLQVIVEAIPETKNSDTTTGTKDAAAIASQNCEKYAEYRNVKKWYPAMGTKPGYWHNTTDCINVVSLISEGTKVKPKEYPHMALIGFGRDFQKVEWSCGGSLISEKFILSLAQCGNTTELGPARWVLLGDLDFASNEDEAKPAVYEIKKIYQPPEFKRPGMHDIALFELNTTVEISPYVRPACLHTSTSIPVNTKGSITGWGTTGAAERRSTYLLKATIPVVDDKQCNELYNNTRLHYDQKFMICAGDTVNGRDTCPGDSGGPLQMPVNKQACMWEIFGITSFGSSICGHEEPGVYTKVAYYLSWIQSIVWP